LYQNGNVFGLKFVTNFQTPKSKLRKFSYKLKLRHIYMNEQIVFYCRMWHSVM